MGRIKMYAMRHKNGKRNAFKSCKPLVHAGDSVFHSNGSSGLLVPLAISRDLLQSSTGETAVELCSHSCLQNRKIVQGFCFKYN